MVAGRPRDIEPVCAGVAEIYDYILGGASNSAIDRAAADALLTAFPAARAYAWINRNFLRRVVAELCRAGIDQFLDLGSGIPSVGSAHVTAHRIDPATRVVYVDVDPVAVHHARTLLGTDDRVSVIRADAREPDRVLAAAGTAGRLDFSRPVAVLVVSMLGTLDTPDSGGLVAHYRDACVPDSALAISHGAQLAATDADIEAVRATLAHTRTPTLRLRNPEQLEALFAGYSILPPGVTPTASWHPERPVPDDEAAHSNSLAAVGLIPRTQRRARGPASKA